MCVCIYVYITSIGAAKLFSDKASGAKGLWPCPWRSSFWNSAPPGSKLKKIQKINPFCCQATVHRELTQPLGASAPYIHLRIECGGGTYIRSIARDLGRELQSAAHMQDLVPVCVCVCVCACVCLCVPVCVCVCVWYVYSRSMRTHEDEFVLKDCLTLFIYHWYFTSFTYFTTGTNETRRVRAQGLPQCVGHDGPCSNS